MAVITRRFRLGRILGTPGALAAMERAGQTPHEFLDLHVQGIWGDIDAEDAQANEAALRNGQRLLSAYWTAKRERLWVITESDRSVTTILPLEEHSAVKHAVGTPSRSGSRVAWATKIC